MFPAICLVFIRRGVYPCSFMIQIWMGKTLANGSKFAKVFSLHRFVLYGRLKGGAMFEAIQYFVLHEIIFL